MKASVTINPGQLKRVERTLKDVQHGLPKVVSRSINKIAVSTRKLLVDEIAADLMIKKNEVKRRNIMISRASYRKWSSTISISGSRIPLQHFKVSILKRGVSYRISRREGRKKIIGAFRTTTKSGHTGIYKRKGTEATPIMELRGPSIPEVVKNASGLAASKLNKSLAARLTKEIDTQTKVLLAQSK